MNNKKKIIIVTSIALLIAIGTTTNVFASMFGAINSYDVEGKSIVVGIAKQVSSNGQNYDEMLNIAVPNGPASDEKNAEIDMIISDCSKIYGEIYSLPEPYTVYIKAKTDENSTNITFSGKSGIGTEVEKPFLEELNYDFVIQEDLDIGRLY